MDEVDFMKSYTETMKGIEQAVSNGDLARILQDMMHLIGSLNDRVTELQLDDPDE